jgi:hypothetical protein
MASKFLAEMVTRSKLDRTTSRLEVTFCDDAGRTQTVSLKPDALAVLATIANELSGAGHATREYLTKMPTHYAVGVGRHEPVVMLRFEDDPAYGLTAAQAMSLAEALVEQAEAVPASLCSLRH